MTLARKVHLLLLLVAPALCVPRGVALGWCLCEPSPSSCCGTCCEPGDDPGYASPSERDGCPGCHLVEVADFDQLVSAPAPELPEAPDLAGAPPTAAAVLPEPPNRRARAARAPPPRVTATGLLPGVAPLRL